MLRFLLSLSVSLALSPWVSSSVSSSADVELQRRLEELCERLESARVAAHVPGMSIAVVKDDVIVLVRGFGLADVDAEKAAEAETIYAIGSSTKAFTATLVGMLGDDGALAWDDPVARHLPYFDLAVRSDDEDAECTLRDLLSHRHGYPRMSILWFSGDTGREEILRTAANAEPWDDFRAGFHYSNVMYLAAGEAAGAAADSSWDELMVQRIFEPLGMSSSTLTASAVREDARLARGYRWLESSERLEPTPFVDLQNVGPAGSVNSSVVDLAQWLRLQLGRGVLDGQQLISTERLLETWTPQIEMGPGVSYGMGWMLREHDGREVVEHGGNIDGFSAQVSLVPEENLGFALLMNLSASPLREASIGIVLDTLLEAPSEPIESLVSTGAETADLALEDYVGTYVANFAKFRDEEFVVQVTDGSLTLDIPSQQVFELQEPDRDGRWGFALTDRIAVSFDRDPRGDVVALRVHQGEFGFEVPRKGRAIEPDAPADELEKYAGTYVRAEGGKRVRLFVAQGRLNMEDKGNRLAFQTPDAEGHAALRARADQGATFTVDAEGRPESFIFHGEAGDKLFTRLADESDGDLPTLDELFALRSTDARLARVEANTGTRVTGEAWLPQAGVRGTVTLVTQGRDRYASHMDFGKFGRIDTVSNGDEAWAHDSLRGLRALEGGELTQAILGHPDVVEGDWRDYFDAIEVLGRDTVNERPVYVVRLGGGDFPSRTYRIDAEHGDVLRANQTWIEGPMRVPVTVTYTKFAESGGLRWPMQVEMSNPASGRTVLTFEKVSANLELGDEAFTPRAIQR